VRLYQPKIELHVYVGLQKFEIRELDMEFEAELFLARGKKAAPNTCRVSVYNLSQASRDLFSEEHQAIELYAGYGDSLGMIFVGETTNVSHERERTGWRTDIYAADGIKAWETLYFRGSFPAGTPSAVVLTEMAKATGLAFTVDTFDADVLLKGESFDGRVKDTLDAFCKDRDLEWSIQYGTLEITAKDFPLIRDPRIVVLSSDSGMLGQPVITARTEESGKKSVKNKKKDKKEKLIFGVRVRSLLNHEIIPGRLVQIKSSSAVSPIGQILSEAAPVTTGEGVYIARIVRHRGDVGLSRIGEFSTEIEGDIQ
jgi:hypothetical protein